MPSPRTGTAAATAGGAAGAAAGVVVGAIAGVGAATAGGAVGDAAGTVLGAIAGDGAATSGGAVGASKGRVNSTLHLSPWDVVPQMFAYTAGLKISDLGADYFVSVELFPNLNDAISIDSGGATIVVTATTSSLEEVRAGRATWSALYTGSGVHTVANSKTAVRIAHTEGAGDVLVTISADLKRPVR